MTDTTQLLIDARSGASVAVERLFEHVYDELRRLARAQLRRGSANTLQTTELVHEAYLKLFDEKRIEASDRVHFLSLAARAMRQILVDHFRRRFTQKRGGASLHQPFDEATATAEERGEAVLAVDEALSTLALHDERLGKVVEFKFFGGMNEAEIATALGLSIRSVSNDWRRAKAWLARELGDS